jgi:hypothetical protein
MALSDCALADIGLRRADVFAAMVGVIPLGRRKAAICRLPCRPGPRTIAIHFCDAA